LEDYLQPEAITVIEWAERAESVPEAALWIRIDPVPGEPDSRSILIETESAEWGERIEHVTRQNRS
jgi:tRNA A37 threonylcarbamoyladenosine biosynthesis protein TsaE